MEVTERSIWKFAVEPVELCCTKEDTWSSASSRSSSRGVTTMSIFHESAATTCPSPQHGIVRKWSQSLSDGSRRVMFQEHGQTCETRSWGEVRQMSGIARCSRFFRNPSLVDSTFSRDPSTRPQYAEGMLEPHIE